MDAGIVLIFVGAKRAKGRIVYCYYDSGLLFATVIYWKWNTVTMLFLCDLNEIVLHALRKMYSDNG